MVYERLEAKGVDETVFARELLIAPKDVQESMPAFKRNTKQKQEADVPEVSQTKETNSGYDHLRLVG
jgi:hypothetical protein